MWFALACAAPEVPTDSAAPTTDVGCDSGPVTLDLAQPGTSYGLSDGDSILYGQPSQGGPPYVPFRVRMTGMTGLAAGALIDVQLVDMELGPIGSALLTQGYVCANAGADVGHWVGAEVHARTPDWTLEALEGRLVEVTATLTAADGTVAFDGYTGTMALLP